jgi:flagellar biosynthesis/type III secretory pathway protein FliH
MFYEDSSYAAIIRRRVGRKAKKLARSSLLLGQHHGEAIKEEIANKLRQGIKRLYQAKIDLVIERAKDIIADHLERDPTAVISIMQKLFKNIAEHTDVEITAHPKDILIIKSALNEGAHSYTAARKVSLQEDDGFERGSLVIKANKSIIDAHLHTQLRRAHAILLSRTETSHGHAH